MTNGKNSISKVYLPTQRESIIVLSSKKHTHTRLFFFFFFFFLHPKWVTVPRFLLAQRGRIIVIFAYKNTQSTRFSSKNTQDTRFRSALPTVSAPPLFLPLVSPLSVKRRSMGVILYPSLHALFCLHSGSKHLSFVVQTLDL
jgi:hypothetical protein